MVLLLLKIKALRGPPVNIRGNSVLVTRVATAIQAEMIGEHVHEIGAFPLSLRMGGCDCGCCCRSQNWGAQELLAVEFTLHRP